MSGLLGRNGLENFTNVLENLRIWSDSLWKKSHAWINPSWIIHYKRRFILCTLFFSKSSIMIISTVMADVWGTVFSGASPCDVRLTTVYLFWFSYAIDWEPSHRRIRVMLGKSGKIVCILKVDPLYSSGQGHVHLLGVDGGSYHKEIQHLQVQWYLNLIEHLLDSLHQEAFVNAPRNKREARLTGGKCRAWGVPKTKKAREVSVAIPLYLTRLLVWRTSGSEAAFKNFKWRYRYKY